MDGLLGVVVCDEVDGELVLMSVGHGDWRAERDRRIVTKHVRKLEDLDLVELDGLLSLYVDMSAFCLCSLLGDIVGGDIVGGAGVFFWRGEQQRRDAEMKLLCAHGCGRGATGSRAANHRVHNMVVLFGLCGVLIGWLLAVLPFP